MDTAITVTSDTTTSKQRFSLSDYKSKRSSAQISPKIQRNIDYTIKEGESELEQLRQLLGDNFFSDTNTNLNTFPQDVPTPIPKIKNAGPFKNISIKNSTNSHTNIINSSKSIDSILPSISISKKSSKSDNPGEPKVNSHKINTNQLLKFLKNPLLVPKPASDSHSKTKSSLNPIKHSKDSLDKNNLPLDQSSVTDNNSHKFSSYSSSGISLRKRARSRSRDRGRSNVDFIKKNRSSNQNYYLEKKYSFDNIDHIKNTEPLKHQNDDSDITLRSVFPYEDGGIIIGTRGCHLDKLRKTVPKVSWYISGSITDMQDRLLVISGRSEDVAEAYGELAKHFLSQQAYIDYNLPFSPSSSQSDIDSAEPFFAIRFLIPHRTCGAIIGYNSDTLHSIKQKGKAYRLKVYQEFFCSSRERIIEVIGTPKSVREVTLFIAKQVEKVLSRDQRYSNLYSPRRNGLRHFLLDQGTPERCINLVYSKKKPYNANMTNYSRSRDFNSRRGSESESSRSKIRSRSPYDQRDNQKRRDSNISAKNSNKNHSSDYDSRHKYS
ncbi:hypothetical protein BB561_002053 [Smittium simulii]|uniref:K Homology domain-containing protein n=1 Tax=Smittium simulii TaxID=133385 RepID=A0A2T9YRX0_9FUNG|nr:hypothetical protein BB561_002053 [Smittium simulii]